jgi:hypothetical protein
MTRRRNLPAFRALLAAGGCLAVTVLVSGPVLAPDRGPEQPLLVATEADHATVAVISDGAALVAWVGAPDGIPGIFVTRVEDGGTRAPVRLTAPGDRLAINGQAPPQVRVGPTGEVYVAWQTSVPVEGRRFPAGDIRLARSTDGGRSFEPAVQVNQSASGPPASNGFHDLAVAADGTLFVSWISGSGPDIRVARSVDGGRSFGPGAVVDRAPCPCCRTALAVAPDGGVYVAWRKLLPDGVRDIVVAASRDGGQSFGAPRRVHRDEWSIDACPHAGPGLAVDARGGVHLAWFTGAPGRAGLQYAYAASPQLRFAKPVALGATGGTTAQVRLGAGEGSVWGVWEEHADGVAAVRVARMDGRRARPVAGPDLNGRSPAMDIRGDTVAVVWNDRGSVLVLRGPAMHRGSRRMGPRHVAFWPNGALRAR